MLGFEDRFGLRNHRADGSQDLAEGHAIQAQTALGAERRLCELTLLRIQKEQIGHRT